MIYSILLVFVKLAIRGYFRKINLVGRENFPKKGAAVFIVNHPSALLDPLLVTILAGRHLHYIAAAEYFGNRFTKWLFKKQFNMIPVYRPDLYKGGEVNNDHMFQHCYEALANDGIITIFPEGTSETERKLRTLKSGTIRMVRGAEKFAGKKIPIIPIGINYTNPHRFQSDVMVCVGEPIIFTDEPEKEEREIVIDHTAYIEKRLREQVVHIEDENLETTIQRVEQVFARQLQQDFKIGDKDFSRKFSMTKDVIAAVEHFKTASPESVEKMSKILDNYYSRIEKLPMRGRLMNSVNTSTGFFEFLSIFILFPLYLPGFIINALPYYISNFIFKKKFLTRIKATESAHQISPVFSGSIAFGIGAALFGIWYLLLSITIAIVTFWWWGVIFFMVAYWSGQLSLWYLGIFRRVKERLKLRSIMKRFPDEMNELIQLNNDITDKLKDYSRQFLNLSK